MRRFPGFTLLFAILLLSSMSSINPLSDSCFSASQDTPKYWSQNVAEPNSRSCCVSPPESSPSSIAYVTNVSNIAYWQREFATNVNKTRLLGLLSSLTSFNNRHPFTIDGNASIDFVASYLTSLGIAYSDDWFSIPKQIWTGTYYLTQYYWTRNLYITPWGINASAPSLIITCHLDSAKHGLLGMSPTNAPGANDNAAGIAAVLESLQILTHKPGSYQNWNMVFAFLGGEEGNGTLSLWGSNQLLSHGLGTLGINPSTSYALNIDEIAYQGIIWPSLLAQYRYLDDAISPIQNPLNAVAENLDITLVDTQIPRAENLDAVHTDLGWCITEWALHTYGIPSLTISTDQYPDPYKHTLYDGLSHCAINNVVNVSKLIIGLVLELAYELPPEPPNLTLDWVPLLSKVGNINITDYLDPFLNGYQAIVLDPLHTSDANVVNRILSLSPPLFALGRAGASFLHEAYGISFSTKDTQPLSVQGLKAFHPVIQSPSLLQGKASQLFRNYSLVYAVDSATMGVNLVGNETWSSLGYFPPARTSIPLLFLGIQEPSGSTINRIVTEGLNWLIELSSTGICLGIDLENPTVGSTPTLYIFVGDLTNWTGLPLEPIILNITVWDLVEEYHLITNESGVGQIELFLKAPTTYSILSRSGSGLEGLYHLLTLPVCTAHLQYSPTIYQGEYLVVNCYVNSSLNTPSTITLSLFESNVGFVEKVNLLLVPGQNLYHLRMEILPSCPPHDYNLTLQISGQLLTLLADKVPLTVQSAFILALIEFPEHILQNQPFLVTVNVTNLGSQSRAFDIVANPNFAGSVQAIVQSNETRTISVLVQYLPVEIFDIGPRQFSLTLISGNHRIFTVECPILIGYSMVNLILSLLPPLFLFGLCVLGVIWMKRRKRGNRSIHRNHTDSRSNIPGQESLRVLWGVNSEEMPQEGITLSPQVMERFTQTMRDLGLVNTGRNRYSKDRVIITWENQGQNLHILIQGDNSHLTRQLLGFLSDSSFTLNQDDDLRVS